MIYKFAACTVCFLWLYLLLCWMWNVFFLIPVKQFCGLAVWICLALRSSCRHWQGCSVTSWHLDRSAPGDQRSSLRLEWLQVQLRDCNQKADGLIPTDITIGWGTLPKSYQSWNCPCNRCRCVSLLTDIISISR